MDDSSFRLRMPESSHKDVNPRVAIKPFSNTYATDMSPSMALDSGIHAGMTEMGPSGRNKPVHDPEVGERVSEFQFAHVG